MSTKYSITFTVASEGGSSSETYIVPRKVFCEIHNLKVPRTPADKKAS